MLDICFIFVINIGCQCWGRCRRRGVDRRKTMSLLVECSIDCGSQGFVGQICFLRNKSIKLNLKTGNIPDVCAQLICRYLTDPYYALGIRTTQQKIGTLFVQRKMVNL